MRPTPFPKMHRPAPRPASAPPPADLPAPEAETWRRLAVEFGLSDGAALVLLEAHCRAAALAREIRERLAKEGLIVATARGTRPHPLLPALNAADKRALEALRLLNLDVAPLHPHAGRPPAG
jgi:phage terminase small subunit